MKELLVLSNLVRFVETQLANIEIENENENEYNRLFESEIRRARLTIIEAYRRIYSAYSWSILKGSHEPNLPSISGESMASKQPVHGEG